MSRLKQPFVLKKLKKKYWKKGIDTGICKVACGLVRGPYAIAKEEL